MKFLKNHALGLLAIGLVLPVSISHAQSIVHWQGDYVGDSSNLNLPNLTTADNGNTRTWQYNSSNSITPTTGYSAPSGRTSRIDGALQNTAAGGVSNFRQAAVVNVAGEDIMAFRADGTGDTSIMGMIYFQKSGFLTGDASLSSLNGIEGKLNIEKMSAGNAQFRFTVLSGTQWYVSQDAASGAGIFSLANLGGTTKWGTWNPTGAPISTTFGTFDVDGSSLTNINAFGWFFNVSRSAAQATFDSPEFLIAVPEPTTWVLLTGGVLAVAISRRRRLS